MAKALRQTVHEQSDRVLVREYHGQQIISKMNTEEIEGSDGWTHHLGGKTYATLAAAIQAAKPPRDVDPGAAASTTTEE